MAPPSKTRSKVDFLRLAKSEQYQPGELSRALESFDFNVEEVLWCLFSRNQATREFGALAIARSSQPAKVEILYEQIRQERSTDRLERLAEALDYLGQTASTGLSKLVNEPVVQYRQLALFLLVRQKDWFLQRELVTTLLQDPAPEITAATIKAVLEAAPDRYTGLLRHLASDTRPEIRDMVLRWLVSRQDPTYTDVFLARIPFEPALLRDALVDTILELIRDYPEETTEYIVAAIGDASEGVRKVAVDLFGQIPDRTKAVEQFLRHAIGTTEWIRDLMFVEATRSPDDFVNGLTQVMKKTHDVDLRLTALNFAAILNDERLLPTLLFELDCNDWVRRYNAVKILSRLGSREAIAPLLRELEDRHTGTVALAALAELRDPSLLKYYLRLIPGATPFLQRNLLRAIAAVGDPRALEHIAHQVERKQIADDARGVASDVMRSLAEENDIPVPPEVDYDLSAEETAAFGRLPDLGLMLEPE